MVLAAAAALSSAEVRGHGMILRANASAGDFVFLFRFLSYRDCELVLAFAASSAR